MKKFKTRAKTAYGLLSYIRKLILEEPSRYDQRNTLTLFEGQQQIRGGIRYVERIPSCGTVGCVAGWVTALEAPTPSRIKNVLAYAQHRLGLTTDQAVDLFSCTAGTTFHHSSQTPEHAQAGAEHIRLFQENHAKQLKATRV